MALFKSRENCYRCRQPKVNCYCALLKPFDSKISFVILIHPIEVKRRIATGRMSHLCLQDSYLIEGQNYSQDTKVNQLITDKDYYSLILYPGRFSKNLSAMTEEDKKNLVPINKKLRLFVIDGTWAKAKTMLRESENLKQLPQVAFVPTRESTFRVRKQPKPNFLSTIEAIHQTLELLGPSQGFSIEKRNHDNLIEVFNAMVERQLLFG